MIAHRLPGAIFDQRGTFYARQGLPREDAGRADAEEAIHRSSSSKSDRRTIAERPLGIDRINNRLLIAELRSLLARAR